ncbi:hypothetical protein FSP39_006276 [Pinctada imbricata]|uniref:Uncharacterized protein n=1 Tax=Pinctada imbricata TaxID=66713 RepID=A0AA88YE06_PINIB|nr:hypothetical protein FSP39_006276 [Pinctada imbricata]
MTGPVQTSLEKTGPRPPVLSECQSDSSGDNIHELAAAEHGLYYVRLLFISIYIFICVAFCGLVCVWSSDSEEVVLHHNCEGPPGTPMVILENLCHNNVFIIFQQHHKLRLRPVIPFFDEELDVAILVLQEPESRKDVPPPLKLSFEPPVKGQTFTLSGFGHPIHNKQVLEFNVKILDVYSSRVVEAKKWVEHNSQVIANTLLYNGKVHCAQDIERSYHPIDRTHNVAIDCFMEKGASGAPGICFPSDKLNPEVSFMVSGGLPIFFWNLHEIHMGHIPPEIRMEYAVTMSAVREKMLYNNMVNLYNECFFPETFMSLNQGADHEISDALRRLTS